MQFYEPVFLMGLWLLPILFLFFLGVRRIKLRRWLRFGQQETISRMSMNYSYENWYGRIFLTIMVFLLLIVTLGRPQWGAEKKKLERKGLDVVFLLELPDGLFGFGSEVAGH